MRRNALTFIALTIGVLGSSLWIYASEATPTATRSKTITMEVTAYCPCKKCCGKNARGVTASGKKVDHNDGLFVAADTGVLPFHTKLVVPGYAQGKPVPVIDTGSAIKGNKLDVFFASHTDAKKWGRQKIEVTVIDAN